MLTRFLLTSLPKVCPVLVPPPQTAPPPATPGNCISISCWKMVFPPHSSFGFQTPEVVWSRGSRCSPSPSVTQVWHDIRSDSSPPLLQGSPPSTCAPHPRGHRWLQGVSVPSLSRVTVGVGKGILILSVFPAWSRCSGALHPKSFGIRFQSQKLTLKMST